MAETTIEWTTTRRPDGTLVPGFTFNPWRGCQKVSDGCKNCYAETLSKRNPATLGEWGPDGKRAMASESYWKQPVKWNRDAEKAGERRRVFCASLADVFEARGELIAPRIRLFKLIKDTPHLDWLILTKRPESILSELDIAADIMREELEEATGCLASIGDEPSDSLWHWLARWLDGNPPKNVWLGTSVENQAAADERIPTLLEIPAVVRFLSCEPLLGAVDLTRLNLGIRQTQSYGPRRIEWNALTGWELQFRPDVPVRCDEPLAKCKVMSSGPHRRISWVIAGGESGPNARPMAPAWARSLRDQCVAADVPFLFKQWGEYFPAEDCSGRSFTDGHYCDYTSNWRGAGEGVAYVKAGKKKAGRLLDGRTWDEFPRVAE